MSLLLALLACGGPSYIVTGTLVDLGPRELVVEHGAIDRVGPAGLSTFQVGDTAITQALRVGDHVLLRITPYQDGYRVLRARADGAGTASVAVYPLQGVVVGVEAGRLLVDHDAIEGVMDAMLMPLAVDDPAVLSWAKPGDRIDARLVIGPDGSSLRDVQRVGQGEAPVLRSLAPVAIGHGFPQLDLLAADGSALRVGAGQGQVTVLTFLYTSCPLPEYCPATVARLQALQPRLPAGVRIVAVTLDPEHDTPAVLTAFGATVGATPGRWWFARADPLTLERAAMRAGLTVVEEDGRILHGLRLLLLDADGRLLERYDDNRWSLDEVVGLLGD